MHFFLKCISADLMTTYSLLMSVSGHESQGVLFCKPDTNKRNVSSALDLSIIRLWKIKLSG